MQQDFFAQQFEKNLTHQAPLALRMRPENLESFYGQEHIVGEGKILNRLIKADRLSSVIFYGPPGTGKTSLANVIAKTTKSDFYEINAVTAGKKEITEVIEQAKQNLSLYKKKTILFIDEIHRFNKAQQDLLLPAVEEGLIILVGATTENPIYEINSPLISRSTLFEFKPLTQEDMKKIILKAITDQDIGLGNMNIEITDDALEHLIQTSNGDIRRALNAVELASLSEQRNEQGKIVIDQNTITDCIQKKIVNYDKKGDNHYDTISAFIKSVRGSDPDAALFWLAKMLDAGEDPKFIARRLVILASEDVGNAEPQALPLAVAAAQAVEMIGLPEARINLAQATTFLASSPKSNASYMGLNMASEALKNESDGLVPYHLKNVHAPGSVSNNKSYVYPHNYEDHYVEQQYLPDDIKEKRFYFPTELGEEKYLKSNLERLKNEE